MKRSMVKTSNSPDVAPSSAENMGGDLDDDPGPSCLDLLIDSEQWNAFEGAASMVWRAYEACLAHVGDMAGREVSILLSDDATIARLNDEYRGKPQATNVLSFPAAPSPAGLAERTAPLGDVIIAHETLMREAEAENKPPLFHLAHLVVHGLLHLNGFDHETDQDAARMEDAERAILASINIPDPYPTTSEEEPLFAG